MIIVIYIANIRLRNDYSYNIIIMENAITVLHEEDNQISAEERHAIDAGLADIESGRTISHDEMKQRYERLLFQTS